MALSLPTTRTSKMPLHFTKHVLSHPLRSCDLFNMGDYAYIWRPTMQSGSFFLANKYGRCIPQAAKKTKKFDQLSTDESDSDSRIRKLSQEDITRTSNSKVDAPNILVSSKAKKVTGKETQFNFDERLQSIRRSALEKKRLEEEKKYQPIDYDAPASKPEKNSLGLGAKIGIGFAVIVFGLVFALGDFFPSASNVSSENSAAQRELTTEEKTKLQTQVQKFQETLKSSPEDLEALEGAAVAHAELGEYNDAIRLLSKLTEKSSSNPEAFRLLGEVQYAMNAYKESADAYRNALKNSDKVSLEVVRGLTNALLAAQKPDQAVQELLSIKNRIKIEAEGQRITTLQDGQKIEQKEPEKVDPVQIDLLLGKAYSDWAHLQDALAVYDEIIATHPDDFRGYLAKGILLKENKRMGEAERMFIQARYFAPSAAKPLVDRYSGR